MTAAELLSVAAFLDGRWSQAFPSFGSERTGAPVVSYCRIADGEIRSRAPVDEPDALVVQDATLVNQVDLFAGVGPEGYVLVNTSRSIEELGLGELVGRFRPGRLVTVPATEMALRHLGRPLPNAVLLGGFAVLTGAVGVESVTAAIRRRFAGSLADGNAAAAREAAEYVTGEAMAGAHPD